MFNLAVTEATCEPCFHVSLLQVFFPESEQPDCLKEMSLETKGGGRVQRRSAKIAVYHLQELASAELTKEWPKRKVLQDLVPDDRKVRSCVTGNQYFVECFSVWICVAPIFGSLYVTPALQLHGNLKPFSGLCRYLCSHTNPHTGTQMYLMKNTKVHTLSPPPHPTHTPRQGFCM